MRSWWRSLFRRGPVSSPTIDHVNALRATYAGLNDDELDRTARTVSSLPEVVAVAAVLASRVLGVQMFDEQIQGALALADGKVIEMQTGEGKTLAAVPAVAWLARAGQGVHVLTANDYLARRDADWMGGIYERMGLSVAAIDQTMIAEARRAAYRADVTYGTANEVGFDYLRDGLAFDANEQVQRPFASVVVDEADSILIDEARIPLVIAGGTDEGADVAVHADRLVRELVPGRHFTVDAEARNVALTPAGVTHVERGFGCENLFDPAHLSSHTAIQDALHAHVLLRRDVDYLVADDAVLPVDEFKGRVVPDRRWPAGLQTALEAKERVRRNRQGRVLGSITIEHLMALYSQISGMTGTAATQAEEFRDVYGLDVSVIPTHRPVARVDHPDELFASKAEKERAVRDEVRRVHATGRPVLVGTSSVEESERLSRALGNLPHQVLNARHAAAEAAIIARAGERGAITISTNMAGRGVDIRLGPGVADLGGLHVIGTNRHDSRRIDHQLRGRAGRQGDPGSSRFFVSQEDPLMKKYGEGDAARTADQLQRMAEGRNLDIRLFLRKYESVIEGQRLSLRARRNAVLQSANARDAADLTPLVRLATLDDLWADYLAAASELRAGTAWISLGYGDPLRHYLQQVHGMFGQLEASIEDEVAARLERVEAEGLDVRQRGATWTYLSTDEPFGQATARIIQHIAAFLRQHLGLG
jgi:preprotein translocase subunit SecA